MLGLQTEKQPDSYSLMFLLDSNVLTHWSSQNLQTSTASSQLALLLSKMHLFLVFHTVHTIPKKTITQRCLLFLFIRTSIQESKKVLLSFGHTQLMFHLCNQKHHIFQVKSQVKNKCFRSSSLLWEKQHNACSCCNKGRGCGGPG